MATRKKTAKKSTALAKYDEALAKYAHTQTETEAGEGGGQFLSVRGGQLTYEGSPVEDNQMAVIILDHIRENVFYEGAFDSENPAPPACFAFGRDLDGMAPHDKAADPQADTCADCDNNAFGSASTGRGKACANRRRLALIPAGEMGEDGFEQYEDSDVYRDVEAAFLKLPVTSVKNYSNFVKKISKVLKRPTFGVFCLISVVPDEKTQFKLTFELIDVVPDELLETLIAKHEEVKELIDFPYEPATEEQKKKPVRRAKKKAAKKGARKY